MVYPEEVDGVVEVAKLGLGVILLNLTVSGLV
jgi:hypothetical protein